MSTTAEIEVKNGDISGALRGFFRAVLESEGIRAILVPQRLPMRNTVMPTLVGNPDQLDGVDPLAPCFPLNAAKIVSKLTRKPMGGKIAAVLRPCEIRAFVELVKLKQGTTDNVVLIGLDCLGAFTNSEYSRFARDGVAESTAKFCQTALSGKGIDGFELAAACAACEHPVPETADIRIGLFGMDVNTRLLVQSATDTGDEMLADLKLSGAEEPEARKSAIEKLIGERKANRDGMFAQTAEAMAGIEKLSAYFAECVNCYNCRVACPVCYCKECVFATDVFDHDPHQYLQWAGRKGVVKMPTDTIFYHLTRLAHMSPACVGCGQCSNACPNDIPVMEIFRTVAHRTQKAFDYEAGRDVKEEPPLSVFKEEEFGEVVGI